MLISILISSVRVFRRVEDDFDKGLSLGFLGGTVGIMFHCIGANTFIIVRIMEPFWFLAAIVMMLPYLETLNKQDVDPSV